MVEFLQARDAKRFLVAAGVLAHYVGDGSQPLHGSIFDDGYAFRQKNTGASSAKKLSHGKGYGAGVHAAYETAMVGGHYDKILPAIAKKIAKNKSHGMPVVKGGQQAGFAVVELSRRSRKTLAPQSIVDEFLSLHQQHKPAPGGLWSAFSTETVNVLYDGCATLAMIWDSAWIEGHGTAIPKQDLKEFTHSELKAVYEKKDFLPSVPLKDIDQQL